MSLSERNRGKRKSTSPSPFGSVATAVNAGAALVYSARVLDAYEQVTAA
jgi:hypothetical protein